MKNKKKDFKFIDLFAGIGGIRIAFEKSGGECVFSSEYDCHAQKTYNAFFGEKPDFSMILKVNPPGDITQLSADLVPYHDILTAGFPCQPFSLAGVSKKKSLGRKHGFEDPTQGTLFFNIKEILQTKKPKAFLLENVKNLQNHDNQRTFAVIKETLEQIGYNIFYRVIDGAKWVPQHRERIFVIGFRRPKIVENGLQKWNIRDFPEFDNLKPTKKPILLKDILESNVPEKYTLGDGTWSTLKRHKISHKEKGNGFGYGMITSFYPENMVTRTLSARYHKDGAEILIEQPEENPRRLTPLECLRLMGFPKKYEKYFDRTDLSRQPVSDTQAYRQFGNCVVVPLVTDLAKIIVTKLKSVEAL